MAAISDAAYELVASHRRDSARAHVLLIGRSPEPACRYCAHRLALPEAGGVGLSRGILVAGRPGARPSLGEGGILPVRLTMDGARAYVSAIHLGVDRFRLLPTLFWWSTSDQFLIASCVTGAALAVLPHSSASHLFRILAALWIDYLSLSVAGREFLSYQWDALLLETGFLAMLLAPLVVRGTAHLARGTSTPARWLLLWLLFRPDGRLGRRSSWRAAIRCVSQWTALSVHFETQPLPTPLAWCAATAAAGR